MKKLLPILLFLLSCCHVALSQDYPVQVTTIVTPPYSLYLSDYASPESNTLQVMLQLKELDRPEYRVKLRITIEGQGISLRTKATFMPRAIVLQGGVPEMLTGADMSAYLNPNNMDFLGTTQQAFMRTGMFPEGFYTFKVEVLDYVRNVVVSNAGVGNAFIILNDPPLINLPFNNDKVIATDPQNIIFSWTPRHTASPNAAFSTEYEFTLVELYPENRNPNDAIRAANSIYTTTTSSTSLNYGIIEPLLIPGRKYAFRIRAYDVSGKDLFKNNGYSEVNVFQFGDACVAPLNVKADPLDPVRIKFSWEQQDVHTSYSLEFRKEGTSNWEQQSVINDAMIVPGLQGNTTYEYRVQGQCGSIQGPFSTVATVITPASDTSAFVCGAPVPEIEINTTPLDRDLRLLDIIKTADFEVIITDLTANGDGSYKGTGRAMVPWFKLAGIRVKFSDIKVNQDLRVFSGNVTTIYSKDSRFVLSADLSNDDPEAPDTGSPTAPPAFTGVDTVLTVPITNVTIPTGNNTVIVVTTPSGQTFEIPRERNEDGTFKDTRITDANGDTWTVNSGGDIQRGPNVAPPPAYASRDSVNFRVNFAALENQYYGFDSKHFQEVAEDKININGEDYWIAWKSVESGRQDYVSATASGQTTFPVKVGFKTSNGPALHETGSSAAFRRVSVMGLVDQQVEALTAYVRVQEGQNIEEVQVGRLNVKAYDKVQKKVIVVPVNNASVPAASAISDELNKIYAQAVVGWEVVVEPSITVDEAVIQNLDAGVSSMLSSFPENMMSFVRTFRNDIYRFIDGDAYYIFMVNNPNAGRAGFMPFNRKFGFVYTNKSTNVITTLAHELGHGAFNLRHTFSPEATLAAEGTTDNLMDYNNGTKLKKYQWDLVRNQETINGWFEDDSESASDNVRIKKLLAWIKDNRGNKIDFKKYDFYQSHAFVDVVQFAHDEGEQPLGLYVELGDDGKVDLTTDAHVYSRIGLSVSLQNSTHTGFYVNIYYAENSNTAIKIWAYSYNDFVRLLGKLGVTIGESSYPYYINLYKNAISQSGNDCDKLDVIFETIPPFVTPSLGDDILFKALGAISNCSMDDGGVFIPGTDEEIGVINILKGYSNKRNLFDTLYANPKLVKNLFSKLDGDDAISFVNILRELSDKFENRNTNHFVHLGNVPPEIYEEKSIYRGKVFTLIDGSGFDSEGKLSLNFVIGSVNWSPLSLGTVQAFKYYPVISKINPLDPVRLHLENQEEAHIVPGIYVYYHGTRNNREYLLNAVGTSTNLLGLGSSVRILLTKGAPKILRALAIIEISKAAIDQVMQQEQVKKAIRDAGGAWFVDNWQWISISVDLTVFSADVLSNLVTSGTKASKALREIGENDAAEAVEKITINAQEAASDVAIRITRTLEEIVPGGVIPPNSQSNNLFHRWFDDLLPEELDLVLGNPTLKSDLERRIRWPTGEHEWCMVCEIKTFKNWEVSMSEIHRFRTKTNELKWVVPNDVSTVNIRGLQGGHGGTGSGTFHNELQTMIQQSTSLTDFNTRLSQLLTRWQIDPSLLPPLIR